MSLIRIDTETPVLKNKQFSGTPSHPWVKMYGLYFDEDSGGTPMPVEVGKKVPQFSLAATGEQEISLRDLKGKNVVLYFYPKDSTPGCTREGQDFRDNYNKFKRQNTIILGVSRDSIKSHENFKAKQGFQFELLSDKDETLCKLFDVIKMKNMYGKQVRGIERSTFLIDSNAKLKKEWRKLKVDGHVDEVLAAVKELNKP
jgi:peroxiredoxin Q/BCP